MTIIRKKTNVGKIVIDLTGPEGNAFNLLARVKTFGKQIGLSSEKIQEIRSEMMESDYEQLIKVFDENFGNYVDLAR